VTTIDAPKVPLLASAAVTVSDELDAKRLIVYVPAVVGDCHRTAIGVAVPVVFGKNFPTVVGAVVSVTTDGTDILELLKEPPSAVIATEVVACVYKERTPPALTVAVCPVESLIMLFAVSPEERAACPVVAIAVAG